MNIRDLEYFQELSRLNSFTAVAQSFKVSQPTITYAIKRLERQFDCELFVKDPSHRSVVLTYQGEILARHIEAILAELAVLQKEIDRANHQEVKVGFPPIIRARILSQLIHKGVDLSFMSSLQMLGGGSVDLLQQLMAGDLDFSFIGSLHPLDHPKLITKELYQRPFYIVVSEKHPLAKKRSVSFGEVLNESFLILDEGHTHLEAFNYLNDKYQQRANIFLKLSEISIIGQMVGENLGITLLTDFLPFSELEGLVKIPLTDDDNVSFHVSYAYSKSTVLSPLIEHLIELLGKIK